MPDHVHLLLRANDEAATVSKILGSIKAHSSKRILRVLRAENYGLSKCHEYAVKEARIWQDGTGFDRSVFTASEFMRKAEYIEENPVKAGLSLSSDQYKWCSAGSKILGRDDWIYRE